MMANRVVSGVTSRVIRYVWAGQVKSALLLSVVKAVSVVLVMMMNRT